MSTGESDKELRTDDFVIGGVGFGTGGAVSAAYLYKEHPELMLEMTLWGGVIGAVVGAIVVPIGVKLIGR